MTAGRLIVIAILGVTVLFGAALWWFVVRAYYERVDLNVLPITLASGAEIDLALDAAQAIDADTSPLRFRACFGLSGEILERFQSDAMAYDTPTPLTAPRWFDCFDAEAIGSALEAGEAQAYLATREIARGVDRVVAIFPDGRGYAWTQLNGTLE
ncbi:hypothetical protein A8B78_07670 [Jannaschia sp. EhC01]|nr:hypothetical protein A8B78_07670 [Jannaschia sp. EhC01]